MKRSVAALAATVALAVALPAQLVAVALVAGLLAPGLVTPPLARAAEPATFARLIKAKSLKCVFGPSAAAEWKGSVAVPVIVKDGGLGTMHFDSIDWQNKRARMIGSGGATSVSAWLTGSGGQFVEQTGVGNLVLTTVFAHETPESFLAVSSRHMDLIAAPFPSQNYGMCKVWE